MTATAPNSFDAHAVHEREAIHRIIDRLRPHFPERRAEEVERAVYRAYGVFQHSRVRPRRLTDQADQADQADQEAGAP